MEKRISFLFTIGLFGFLTHPCYRLKGFNLSTFYNSIFYSNTLMFSLDFCPLSERCPLHFFLRHTFPSSPSRLSFLMHRAAEASSPSLQIELMFALVKLCRSTLRTHRTRLYAAISGFHLRWLLPASAWGFM